jgi:hypothetical protein
MRKILFTFMFCVAAQLVVVGVKAQEAPVEEAPAEAPAEPAEVSEEERRLLEAALGGDAQEEEGGEEAPINQGTFLVGSAQGPRGQASSNPNISLILDAAGAYFRGEPRQAGAHDPNKTGFTLQQLELHIDHSVDPYFRLDANIVFAQFGVEVEEAYATTLQLPGGLQARAGQFLTRFGRLNPTHPHSWSFLDQPLVSGKFFGGEGSRGLGAELSWLLPTGWFAELVGSVTDAAGACCARSFYGAQDLGVDNPGDLLGTVALKQFFPLGEDWSLLWGISAQAGPNASGAGNRTEIVGTDLYLRLRPADSTQREAVSWQTEAMLRRRQVPGAVLQDWGLYSQLIWNVDPQWELGARYEEVSGVASDPLDPEWVEARRRATAQVTYYPSHFSRLRLQGGWDQPGWVNDPTWIVMLGLEVLVGAHGAHNY